MSDAGLRDRTHRYIVGIHKNLECPALIVGGTEDHVHTLCRLKANVHVADLIRDVKRDSSKWIKSELRERGWSNNELARRAGLSPAGVSQVMTERSNPGLEFCRGVAVAFDEPPEKVLRLAGLLPQRSERDEQIDEILFHYDRMTPQEKANFRTIARALADGGHG